MGWGMSLTCHFNSHFYSLLFILYSPSGLVYFSITITGIVLCRGMSLTYHLLTSIMAWYLMFILCSPSALMHLGITITDIVLGRGMSLTYHLSTSSVSCYHIYMENAFLYPWWHFHNCIIHHICCVKLAISGYSLYCWACHWFIPSTVNYSLLSHVWYPNWQFIVLCHLH